MHDRLLKSPAHPARPSACRDRPSARSALSACRLGMPTVRPTASRPSATSSRSRSSAAMAMASPPPNSLRQVDLQAADGADRGAGDGRRLVVGEHDRLLGTDPAARRTALLAVVLVLDEDAVQLVHAVDAEQAEVDALHAIRAAAVVDHRIPAPLRLLAAAAPGRSCGAAAAGFLAPAPRRRAAPAAALAAASASPRAARGIRRRCGAPPRRTARDSLKSRRSRQ